MHATTIASIYILTYPKSSGTQSNVPAAVPRIRLTIKPLGNLNANATKTNSASATAAGGKAGANQVVDANAPDHAPNTDKAPAKSATDNQQPAKKKRKNATTRKDHLGEFLKPADGMSMRHQFYADLSDLE